MAILLSYAEEDKVLQFFDYVKSPDFYIAITNGNYKRLYYNKDEYVEFRNINTLLKNHTVVIRWGNRVKLPSGNIIYNMAKSIHSVSDKKAARYNMEKNGIKTIETLLYEDDLEIMTFPVIIRPLHHERGNDFYVCKTLEDAVETISKVFKNNYNLFYVSSYFPRTNEYRIYCAHGKLLFLQEKVGVDKIDILKDDIKSVNKIPWNTVGWESVAKKGHLFDITMECLKANNIFKLDFSATDVLYDSKTNDFRICEINTMPELLGYGFKRFGMYFDYLIELTKSDRIKRHEVNDESDILWRNDFNKEIKTKKTS